MTPGQKRRLVTRRNFLRASAVVGAGLVASTYVKPDFQSIKIPHAFASASAPPISGCIPTRWKDYVNHWAALGYNASDSFNHTFGVTAFKPDKTLWEVINTGGGGAYALGRHSIAALLNCAAVGPSNYGLSETQVKKIVKDAFSSGGIVFIITLILIYAAQKKLESLNLDSCLRGGKLP